MLYVKTQSGRVLVRNRLFIRRRAPLSLPSGATMSLQPPATFDDVSLELVHPSLQQSAPLQNPTRRLIEDHNW